MIQCEVGSGALVLALTPRVMSSPSHLTCPGQPYPPFLPRGTLPHTKAKKNTQMDFAGCPLIICYYAFYMAVHLPQISNRNGQAPWHLWIIMAEGSCVAENFNPKNVLCAPLANLSITIMVDVGRCCSFVKAQRPRT